MGRKAPVEGVATFQRRDQSNMERILCFRQVRPLWHNQIPLGQVVAAWDETVWKTAPKEGKSSGGSGVPTPLDRGNRD
jgi:hypothetical protein